MSFLSAWLNGRWHFVLPLILSMLGVALALVITRLGAYLSDDSYYYIYPAREALAGHGFHPSYIFAPLFPLVLAGLGLLQIDPVLGARWLNAILFGVNIFLVWRITADMRVPMLFALLAGTLVLLSDVVLEAHGWVMSEALSFTFMLLSIHLLLSYLRLPDRRYWGLAALCAALAVLTRYAALPLIAALALTLLVFAPAKRFVARLKDACLFGLLSLMPVMLYWLRNQMTSGHPVRYENYVLQPFTQDQLVWFFYNWYSLFLPGRFLRGHEIPGGILFTLISIALAGGAAWVYRKHWADENFGNLKQAIFLLAAALGFNLLMLYVSRGLTQLDVFNPRYLVPMLILFLMLLSALLGRLWQVSGRPLRLVILAFSIVFLAYYGYRTFDFSRQMVRMGLGYANIGWHNSETVEYIRAHTEMTNMVSTGEMGLYFWTGRKPRVLADFSAPQALHEYLCQNGAVLFLMDQMPADIYGMTHDQAVAGLELVTRFNDSEMYRCPTGK